MTCSIETSVYLKWQFDHFMRADGSFLHNKYSLEISLEWHKRSIQSDVMSPLIDGTAIIQTNDRAKRAPRWPVGGWPIYIPS